MYLNPAYTGLTYEHRFVANYRNQWPGISKAFQTYMASYDYNMSDINSGLGVIVMQDRSGTGGLTHTQFGVNYAYHFKIGRFTEIRMGTGLSYNMKRVDFSKLRFNDQINSGSSTSLDAINYTPLNYVDFNAGALLNATKYWVGFSAKHLSQPNASLTDDRIPLPVSMSLHGGYRIVMDQRSRNNPTKYFSPAFNYRHEQKYDQFDIGLYYCHLPLNIGLWYRGLPFKKYKATYSNRESVAVLVGFDLEDYHLRMGYSYDITVSSLGVNNSLGAHELSLIYEVSKKKKRNSRVLVTCPKF